MSCKLLSKKNHNTPAVDYPSSGEQHRNQGELDGKLKSGNKNMSYGVEKKKEKKQCGNKTDSLAVKLCWWRHTGSTLFGTE